MTEAQKDIRIQELEGIRARLENRNAEAERAIEILLKQNNEQYEGKMIFAGMFAASVVVIIALLVL